MLKRNFARYASTSDFVYLFNNVDDFLSSEITSGIFSIGYGSGTLDLQLIRRNSSNLVIVFHAAANPETLTLPIFVGHNITRDIDASVLLVSDPSLDFGIPIGWFAGDAHRSLQQDLTKIIVHVAGDLEAEHLVFQGSSAGGFAAMFYSHQFPGSLAIPVNPQTDVRNYHADKVDLYWQTCWSGSSQTHPTLDLLRIYGTSFPNFVLYLQNRSDEFHVERHYQPWAAKFSDRYRIKWSALFGEWGVGHAAPPPFFQAALLTFALTFKGDWAELLKSEDFEPGPDLE